MDMSRAQLVLVLGIAGLVMYLLAPWLVGAPPAAARFDQPVRAVWFYDQSASASAPWLTLLVDLPGAQPGEAVVQAALLAREVARRGRLAVVAVSVLDNDREGPYARVEFYRRAPPSFGRGPWHAEVRVTMPADTDTDWRPVEGVGERVDGMAAGPRVAALAERTVTAWRQRQSPIGIVP